MGMGLGNRKYENCWAYRSSFEKALIVSSLLPFVIVILLVTFLIFQLNFVNRSLNSCNNAVCKIEATHLSQRIDTSTNPCNNFYQFSCGSLWKNKSQASDLFSSIVDESKQQILQTYNEPIKKTDYRIVIAAKRFYQTCLNATEVQNEDLDFLNRTLNKVGGWPVVLEHAWDELQFGWVGATYRLRRAGLFFNSLIDVNVFPDNKTDSKFIIKVAIPQPGNIQIKDMNDFLEIVAALGGDQNRTVLEYEDMYSFSLDLRREIYRRYNDDLPTKHTINAFQSKCDLINWKDFLNSIVGPAIKLEDSDKVVFDSPDGFTQWITFLNNVPKRSQANYMIWKGIEPLLPYLQNKRQGQEGERLDICIGETRERFAPSPLDILYIHKHLPDTKITLAQDLVNNIKNEVLQLVEKCDWLDFEEKRRRRERLKTMKQIVGAPTRYLSGDVFIEMDVDMTDLDEGKSSFLSHLLKSNRYYMSRMYQQVAKGQMLKWSLQTGSLIGDYYWDDNVISIPATVLQGAIFNEARPKYVNYGSIGMLLSHHFHRIIIGEKSQILDAENFSNNSAFAKFENKINACLDLRLKNSYLVEIILQQILGFHSSYGAYKKSVHAKEDVGFGGYTASQLFWLSAASYFCQPDSNSTYILQSGSGQTNTFSNLFLSSIASNPNFGEDFYCKPETNTNHKVKCSIF